MGYSGETTYSYGTDGEGTHVDSETYHGGSGSTTYSTVYSHGRETHVKTYINSTYGGTETETYDPSSGMETYSSSGYNGK